MKDYNVTVKVRNNYLLSVMRDRGIETNSELARLAGCCPSDIGSIMNLAVTPHKPNGEVRASVQRVCDALYCFIEDIFPEQHIHNALEKNRAEVELGAEEVGVLISGNSPESVAEIEDAARAITEVSSQLNDRERRVIDMRYGLNGNEEAEFTSIAKSFGISVSRVCQIHGKALRKLRHPVRSDELRPLLEVYQ